MQASDDASSSRCSRCRCRDEMHNFSAVADAVQVESSGVAVQCSSDDCVVRQCCVFDSEECSDGYYSEK